MRTVIVAGSVLVAVAVMLAAAADAQAPLPVTVSLRLDGHGSTAVEVQRTTLPGAVVSVRGATEVIDESGAFTLRTSLPLYLVAVKGQQLRKVTMALPAGAQKWIDRLTIGFDLTTMRAQVEGALTIKNHPPAMVTVEHVQAGTIVRTPVTHGEFTVGLPLVPRTNTLDWTLRAGWISWAAPPLTFDVR